MNRRHLKMLRELLTLPVSPYAEQAVVAWVERFVAARPALALSRDRWGNLLIRYAGGAVGRRQCVFAAHMDHPGFIAGVTQADGEMSARWAGAVPVGLFPGARVRFFSGGKWVRGRVIAAGEREDIYAPLPVRIKISGPVAPGSVGMWDFPDPQVKGNRIYARGCDDVAGTASLMVLLDEACRRKLPHAFAVFLTRAEEAGLVGACGACEARTLPKSAVMFSVETSKALSNARHGDGPIVRVGDASSIFTPAASDFLCRAAKTLAKRDKAFRWQRRLMDGGVCESSVYGAWGYETAGLCLPLGNYHNVSPDGKRLRPEYIDLRDFEGLVKLYLSAVETFADYGKESSAPTKEWWSARFGRMKKYL